MASDENPMTVAELRALLADLPDEMPVFVSDGEFGVYYRPKITHETIIWSDKGVYGDPAWRSCYCTPDGKCDHINVVDLS